MTHVSTPNARALPRQRSSRFGSIGAIVLVIGMGAAIAGAIAVTTDEAPAANTATNAFTQVREQANPAPANTADQGFMSLGAEKAAEEALKQAVKQGQVPAQALQSTSGFAERPGQPR